MRPADDAEAAVARFGPRQRHRHREEPVVHAALVPVVRELVAPRAVVVHLAPVEHEAVRAGRLLDEQREVVHAVGLADEGVVVRDELRVGETLRKRSRSGAGHSSMPPRSARPVTPSPASGSPLLPPRRRSPLRSTMRSLLASMAALAWAISSAVKTLRTMMKPLRSNRYRSMSDIPELSCALDIATTVAARRSLDDVSREGNNACRPVRP